jgi:hypothetical protein
MDRDDISKRVTEEEDYIRCPKFSNSLSKFLAKNSEGVENSVIARLLMIPEEKVEEVYGEAVQQLRKEMVRNYPFSAGAKGLMLKMWVELSMSTEPQLLIQAPVAFKCCNLPNSCSLDLPKKHPISLALFAP